MERQTKLTEAIEALDHVQELLHALPPELLEQGLWQAVMGLSVLQKFLRSFDAAASADARATALIEVSEMMGKKSEGLLFQVIQDPSTPETVTRAARQAQQRVERRARKDLLDELATSSGRRALMDEIVEVIGPRLHEIICHTAAEKKLPSSEQAADLYQWVGQVVEEKLNDNYRKRVEGPVLINYRGWLCACVEPHPGGTAKEGGKTTRVRPGQACLLTAWLQPNSPPKNAAFAEVEIGNGQNADLVPFDVRVDSDGLQFDATCQSVKVPVADTSDRIQFHGEPDEEGMQAIWVQLLQKNRLIQVVELKVEVRIEERGR
jgi:hypothetical protein